MNKLYKLYDAAKANVGRAAAAASIAAMSGSAFASDMATEFTSGVDKPTLLTIGGAVFAVAGILFMIRRGSKVG